MMASLVDSRADSGPHPRPSPGPGLSHTDWSLVLEAQGDSPPARQALERLIQQYWPAVYAYILGSGQPRPAAQDLTQGFVCDVILGRHLVDTADPARGRFRALLLTSLRRYLIEQHRRDTARRRAPAADRSVLSLDPAEIEQVEQRAGPDPERSFAAQWAISLVHRVLDRVKVECRRDGYAEHWLVFDRRVVRPMLFGDRPLPYSELVKALDLGDAAKAANMVVTVKRRFVRALRDEVGRTVSEPWHIGDELRQLMRDLEGAR